MPLLALENTSLAFGHHALLDQVDLQLDSGERVGLIGRNGGGKSSLLRVLAGETRPDDGKVWHAPGLKLAYVAQEPELDPDLTVFQEVSKGLGSVSRVLIQYHEASHSLSDGAGDIEPLLLRLENLQAELEAQDGWRIQARVETAIDKLNLPADALVGQLSGGQKKTGGAGTRTGRVSRRAVAGRADQPPRLSRYRVAGRAAQGFRGKRGIRYARSPLSQQCGDANHRT